MRILLLLALTLISEIASADTIDDLQAGVNSTTIVCTAGGSPGAMIYVKCDGKNIASGDYDSTGGMSKVGAIIVGKGLKLVSCNQSNATGAMLESYNCFFARQ